MRLVIALNHRFARTPDGAVWTKDQFPYSFWRRYLEVFERACVLARVEEKPEIDTGWLRVDGDGIRVAALPPFTGPGQYVHRLPRIQQIIQQTIQPEDAVILRVVSLVCTAVHAWLKQNAHPYGLEVVSDPYDGFAPGAIRHPLRPMLRWWFSRELRQQCAEAAAISYVTEHSLQRRYPPGPAAYTTNFSSVELPPAAFVPSPRRYPREKRPWTLIFVGTLDMLRKAPGALITATAMCVRDGLDLRLVMVGGGRYQPELEAQAAALGLDSRAVFCGVLPAGAAVRERLDQADLFVLPSFCEGLPRAMLEAMARGLPCIGSTAGGVSELLPEEDLAPPGNARALAEKISAVFHDPERLTRMSRRNLETAREYREEVLCAKRIAFYRNLKQTTEAWAQMNRG